jgi:hypothetical protein
MGGLFFCSEFIGWGFGRSEPCGLTTAPSDSAKYQPSTSFYINRSRGFFFAPKSQTEHEMNTLCSGRAGFNAVYSRLGPCLRGLGSQNNDRDGVRPLGLNVIHRLIFTVADFPPRLDFEKLS